MIIITLVLEVGVIMDTILIGMAITVVIIMVPGMAIMDIHLIIQIMVGYQIALVTQEVVLVEENFRVPMLLLTETG